MARELRGKPVADSLTADAAARVEALKSQGTVPTLAILRVGERPDDLSYERAAENRCAACGIEVVKTVLGAQASQEEVFEAIEAVNGDSAIHGCLLFRPLPAPLDEEALCSALDPAKDVDGITAASLYGVFASRAVGFPPCTAEACLRLLDYYDVPLDGARVVVIGRSLVIGRPVAALLTARDATVTLCHSHTKDLGSLCRQAEIVVAAAGRAGIFDGRCAAEGQVLVDVGMNWDEAQGVFCGDGAVAALEIVEAFTPVPGGVGAVTTAVLATHVVEAAERSVFEA